MTGADDFDPPLDPGIAPFVATLRRGGVETSESCEGGDGHAFPVPTIRFHGGQPEGFRALGVALVNGLPVAELRRVWSVVDGEPTGPAWELTFSGPAPDAPAQFAEGYVEGQLQWVNTHGDNLLMWIYPWVGPGRIKCKLRPEHVEDAGAALDKWVRVHGTLKYPAHSKHPTFIDVSGIEKLPDKVPSLEGMEGVALNATEGEPSDAFVRRLRDGW